MGFTPAEVGEMSMWELLAGADAVALSNGSGDNEPPPPMSEERLHELTR